MSKKKFTKKGVQPESKASMFGLAPDPALDEAHSRAKRKTDALLTNVHTTGAIDRIKTGQVTPGAWKTTGK